jgi:two-component system, LuxR family, response regulator FixJ
MARTPVYIVDDDAAVRDSMAELLGMHGYETRQFADAAGYLDEAEALPKGCVLLDIRMPGMSGMELQQELRRRGRDEPIVFVTGHGDIGLAVRAMKAGAVDFLQKPCAEEELIDAVRQALTGKRPARSTGESDDRAKAALTKLTEREREILRYVSQGLTSKAIAQRLGISVRTVDIHRANIMNKTDTRNVVELVRLALAGGFMAD